MHVREMLASNILYRKYGFCLDGCDRKAMRRGETFEEVQLSKKIGTRPASAIIVARSAQFRESLVVLVSAIPQIGRIEQAETVSSALSRTGKPSFDLMLCDFESVQDEGVETLQRVKAQWPQLRCVVLVNDDTAYQRAQAIGADRILTKGVLAAKLLETIEDLLSVSRDGGGET